MATIIENGDGSVKVIYESNSLTKTIKNGTKSILPDMESLQLDDKIKQEAEKVYVEMGRPTRKDKTRLELVFACLHFAYAKWNQINSSKELANIVGINSNDIPKIIGKFSLSKVGYHFEQRFYSIPEYISFLSDKIQLSYPSKTLSLEIGSGLVKKRPNLIELQPDLVAGAIIIYTLGTITNSDQLENEKQKLINLIICNQKKMDQMIKLIGEYDNATNG